MTHRIAVIPGDGIGPEVAKVGVRLLERIGLPLQFDWFDFGADRYLKDGTILPQDFLDTLRRDYDAMAGMIIGPVPRFEDVVASIAAIEERLNGNDE